MTLVRPLVRSISTPIRRPRKPHALSHVPRASVKHTPDQLSMQEYKNNFNSDFWHYVQSLKPTDQQLTQRHSLQRKLQSIVNKHFGNFEVQHVGLGRYAIDSRDSPYEFALVDTEVEQGVAGKDHLNNLPPAYDSVKVAQVLMEEGFNGMTQNPATSSLGPGGPPWPHYQRSARREIIYPVRLRATYPIEFDLYLPGPTTIPLFRLLSAYGKVIRGAPQTITLLFLWMRSHGIQQMSPVCVALLFISFLQDSYDFSCLTSSYDELNGKSFDSTLAAGNTRRWALYQRLQQISKKPQWITEPVTLDTAFVNHPVAWDDSTFDPLDVLEMFMKYWGDNVDRARTSLVSVNKTTDVLRHWPYRGDSSFLEVLKTESSSTYTEGRQPPIWNTRPLIVQDPFVYTHNHAEFVSESTLQLFLAQALLSHKSITARKPLRAIFGENMNLVSTITNPRDALALTLQQTYPPEVSQLPPAYIFRSRSLTIKRVQDVIQNSFHVKYRVEVFGSTVYGLDTSTSDLDLVIIDPDRADGFPAHVNLQRLPEVYNVRRIGRELQRAGFVKVLSIPSANVPIVKFKDSITNIECDLNVNDQLGLINTMLVKQYLDLQPTLRPLLKTIKIWARKLGMNSPSGGDIVSFSSYSLTLMTIGFFQAKKCLPNLQDPQMLKGETHQYFWMKTKQGRRHQCDVTSSSVGQLEYPLLDQTLEAVLLQWFEYWGNEFKYETDLISIRQGGIVTRKDTFVNVPNPRRRRKAEPKVVAATAPGAATPVLELDGEPVEEDDGDDVLDETENMTADPKEWATHPLCVADPFILSKNCCSQINLDVITEFARECRASEAFLKAGNSIVDFIAEVARRPPRPPPPVRENKRRVRPNRGKNKNSGGQKAEQKKPEGTKPDFRPPAQPTKADIPSRKAEASQRSGAPLNNRKDMHVTQKVTSTSEVPTSAPSRA